MEMSVSGNAGLFLSPVLNCGSVSRPPPPPPPNIHQLLKFSSFGTNRVLVLNGRARSV